MCSSHALLGIPLFHRLWFDNLLSMRCQNPFYSVDNFHTLNPFYFCFGGGGGVEYDYYFKGEIYSNDWIFFYIYDTKDVSYCRCWQMIPEMWKHFTGEVKHIKNYVNFKWVCLPNCSYDIILIQIVLSADIFIGFHFVRMLFLIWARHMKFLLMMKLLQMFYCELFIPQYFMRLV